MTLSLKLGLLCLTLAGSNPDTEHVRKAWNELVAQGCDLHEAGVNTPVAARVLRNAPYALAGRRFASADLTALFEADGKRYLHRDGTLEAEPGWYRPARDDVQLADGDRACVERLAEHERALRAQLPIHKDVEALVTRGGFHLLREPEVQRATWLGATSRMESRARTTRTREQAALWLLHTADRTYTITCTVEAHGTACTGAWGERAH